MGGLRVGVTLPQFRHDAAPALETARRAEALGLDGVFVFDHLWPIGHPERPALHSLSLLGALVVETERVCLGPLVARVSLLPDAVLVNALQTLHRMAGPRFIAGLGVGDRLNRDENLAYGVGFSPRAGRLAQLADCCRRLAGDGVRTWVGGLSEEIRAVAAREADGWNGWGVEVGGSTGFAARADDVRSRAGSRAVEVTWGGQVLISSTPAVAEDKLARHGARPGLVHGTVQTVAQHFRDLADAGASWAVCAPLDQAAGPESLELLAEAANSGR